ncbi:ribonuclease H-like domain-containing protein [Tanacetum coccineum]
MNAERQNRNQAFNSGNGLTQNDESNQIVQHVPRTESNLGKENVQCYNCNEKGHFARDCQKIRVRDAKSFREQMLLAMKDEAGSNLKDEENDFMLDNSYADETLEELIAIAASEVNASHKMIPKGVHEHKNHEKHKIVIHTSDDDQIDSNIIFDDPYVENNGVESSNSVRRPKSKDIKLKNRVLKNTNDKSSSTHVRKVSSSVRIDSNKRKTMNSTVCQSNASVLNTKTVNAVNDDYRVKRALFTTPVVAKSKNLEATSVVVKSRLSVAKTSTTTNKVSSDPACPLDFLFGNDHFVAITGYGDDVQGNLTICYVYYVEGLGHNLFLVGQFCDGDLEAQILKIRTDNGTDFKNKKLWSFYAKLGIVHYTSIARMPEQNGVVESRNHTLVEAARTMLIFSKTLEFLWAEAITTACFTQNCFIIFCYLINDRDDLGKMKPKADIGIFIGYSESSQDLDNLFGPLYEEYYATSIPEVLDNSAANTFDNKDTLSSSSIVIEEDEAPQIVSSPEEPFDPEPNTPVSNENADELVQKDVAELDRNIFYNPLHTSVFEEAESSSTYQDSSNMHEFHQTLSTIKLKNIKEAMLDHSWIESMQDELDQFKCLNVWELVECPTLVPRPSDGNVARYMWLFRHKFLADGMLSRYNARLVANGSTQLEGVDVDETFSLVVKPGTIRTGLSLAVSRQWPIHQLDVKNAFLHGDLTETVYMHQPPGFQDFTHPDYVCLLQRSLYGLKQAPRRIIRSLHQEFAITNFGPLNYFLGVSITRDSSGLFLSQQKYVVEILKKSHILNCNPIRTPADTESKLGVGGDPVSDPTLYWSLASSLQYLTFTRPDISYAVQQVCLHMHDPRESRLSALKRILRYVQGTLNYSLQLFSSSTTDLVAYSDADWAGCPTTRRSTSGYCVFLGNNLLSWSSKRQPTLSRSSVETEYRGFANVVAETCWLRNLLRLLHTPLSSATLVYCDNVSAVYLSCNSVQHQRTKHIEIDIHFVRDLVAIGIIWTLIAGYGTHDTLPHRLLLRYKDQSNEDKYASYVDETFTQQQDFTPYIPKLAKRFYYQIVIGSSHGLLCLLGYIDRTPWVVLWNPSIRRSVTIVVPNLTYGVVGFDVCPVTSDPMIVKISNGWEV